MKNRSVATGKWPLKGQTEEEVSRASAASSVKPQHWPLARSQFFNALGRMVFPPKRSHLTLPASINRSEYKSRSEA